MSPIADSPSFQSPVALISALVYISISLPLIQSCISERIGRISWKRASQQKVQHQTGKPEITVQSISRHYLEVGCFVNNEASL